MIASAETFTHAGLVGRAVTWLRNGAATPSEWNRPAISRRHKCRVTLAEARSHGSEIPDAIGWAWGGNLSVLVECKVSRSDFLADANKRFRKHPEQGLGQYRYFLAPAGLIDFDEVPLNWGLLELKSPGGRISVTRIAFRQESDTRRELSVLWSALSMINWDSSVAMSRIRCGLPIDEQPWLVEEHY